MTAGLGMYRAVLQDPQARGFTAAGFVARMPLSMTGLGIVLMISISTGSFGRAGLVTAFATVSNAICAPLWGRLIDRAGQARVLIMTSAIYTISLSLVVVTVQLDLPLVCTLFAAVGTGVGFTPAGACVRARWAHRIKNGGQLDTAYAFEAVIDEVVFIVGPVLATFLATSIHPAVGLVTCIALGLFGALALAAQPGTQPPVRTKAERNESHQPRSPWLLVPIVLACAALGALFGGMEVVIVAFATEAGILKFAGFLAMAWAAGSLVAGVITGTISWSASPAKRFRVGALLLGLSMLPLPFVSNPALVSALLIVSGLAIAPTLIASVAVTQSSLPPYRLTEALSWTSTGLAAGVAAGAAGLGQVIDRWGAQAGFRGLVVAGVVLIVASLCVRAQTPPIDTQQIDTEHIDTEQKESSSAPVVLAVHERR